MSKYSQGVMQDGAAILKDGERMTIEEILGDLRKLNALTEVMEARLASNERLLDIERLKRG